jgi:hypothetical protein
VGDPLDGLSPEARQRLETFAAAFERIQVDDLPLYAVKPREPGHRRAVDAAAVASRAAGLDEAIEGAREAIFDYVARAYANAQYRTGYIAMNSAPGLGPTDDRVRVMRSLGDAVAALALGDALDEADRAELLGAWANVAE